MRIEEVEEKAIDFADKFSNEKEDMAAWSVLYDSAMFFFNTGRQFESNLVSEIKKENDKNEAKDLAKELSDLAKGLILKIYSNVEAVDYFMKNKPEETTGQDFISKVAVEQAQSLINELNKT